MPNLKSFTTFMRHNNLLFSSLFNSCKRGGVTNINYWFIGWQPMTPPPLPWEWFQDLLGWRSTDYFSYRILLKLFNNIECTLYSTWHIIHTRTYIHYANVNLLPLGPHISWRRETRFRHLRCKYLKNININAKYCFCFYNDKIQFIISG